MVDDISNYDTIQIISTSVDDSAAIVYTNIIKEYNVKYLPLHDSSFGTITFSGTTMNIVTFRNTINKIIGIKYTPTV